jgi:O-antigen ligase
VVLAIVWRLKPWAEYQGPLNSMRLRLAYWRDAIFLVWWPEGWKHRLFGFGSQTWFAATIRMGEARRHPEVFTMAHNEFIQQLLEHGILGLVILCGYFVDALWRTAHGGPEGQAVFLIGMVWIGIALVNFPFAWYHEYHPSTEQQQRWYGSPTLNAWAFITVLLVEAF